MIYGAHNDHTCYMRTAENVCGADLGVDENSIMLTSGVVQQKIVCAFNLVFTCSADMTVSMHALTRFCPVMSLGIIGVHIQWSYSWVQVLKQRNVP